MTAQVFPALRSCRALTAIPFAARLRSQLNRTDILVVAIAAKAVSTLHAHFPIASLSCVRLAIDMRDSISAVCADPTATSFEELRLWPIVQVAYVWLCCSLPSASPPFVITSTPPTSTPAARHRLEDAGRGGGVVP